MEPSPGLLDGHMLVSLTKPSSALPKGCKDRRTAIPALIHSTKYITAPLPHLTPTQLPPTRPSLFFLVSTVLS